MLRRHCCSISARALFPRCRSLRAQYRHSEVADSPISQFALRFAAATGAHNPSVPQLARQVSDRHGHRYLPQSRRLDLAS